MENKQENNPKDRELSASKSLNNPTILDMDDDIIFAFKKAERLASALYLITSFFDDKEPLKWKLRMLGSDLLSGSLSSKDGYKKSREKILSDLRNIILEVESHLNVARNAGLISEINFSIVEREFSNLFDRLTSDLTLTRDYFFIPTPKVVPEIRRTEGIKAEKPASTKETSPRGGAFKGHLLDDFSSSYKPRVPREDGIVSIKKNKRQNVILTLLKQRKEIMIKDVTPLIAGVSEKTIQRELLSMVKLGILKKVGEKRWSRYSLA